MTYSRIVLKSGKEEPVRRFHPWIFSGAIDHSEGNIEEGDVVEVFDSRGNYLATGHAQRGSLAVKLLSFKQMNIDKSFWKERLMSAFRVREATGLLHRTETNAYRLVFGEGDSLPGLVIDHYAGTYVLQAHSVGMYQALPIIAAVLRESAGDSFISAYSKSADVLSKLFQYEVVDGFLEGTTFPEYFLENGIQYMFDYQGQKTGFFCDQRQNRQLAGQYAAGKKVLDVCCFSGGFGLNALKAGASRVVFVDSSKQAISQAEKNCGMNAFSHMDLSLEVADARIYLEGTGDEYDMVILDPPAFAKHNSDRSKAIQGYRSLNRSAMMKVSKGGLLFTFSCSQVVDRSSFCSAVTAAAVDTGRNIRLLQHLGQGPDHPVNIFHPEGEYLKGLMLMVE